MTKIQLTLAQTKTIKQNWSNTTGLLGGFWGGSNTKNDIAGSLRNTQADYVSCRLFAFLLQYFLLCSPHSLLFLQALRNMCAWRGLARGPGWVQFHAYDILSQFWGLTGKSTHQPYTQTKSRIFQVMALFNTGLNPQLSPVCVTVSRPGLHASLIPWVLGLIPPHKSRDGESWAWKELDELVPGRRKSAWWTKTAGDSSQPSFDFSY